MKNYSPTILIVEDEKSLLKVWTEIFRREGYNVLTAFNAKVALNLALRWHPNLVVIDLVLSNSDGLAFVKKLRETKWGQEVPVMFLSAWLGVETGLEYSEYSQAPAQDFYLNDNWSFNQVLQEVRDKLKRVKLAPTQMRA